MHKRQLTIVGIVLIALAILLNISSFQQEAQTKKPQTQDEEATVVQRGQVTAEELEYTKELGKFYGDEKLTELAGKEDIGVEFPIGSVAHLKTETAITASQILEKLSCEANAVVIGQVKDKQSHLSADETFVFTTYNFEVKRVIKDNYSLPIEVDKTITVARPGGLIKIDGRLIKFNDAYYKPLQLSQEYLLFLKFVPTTNGYKVSSLEGDFALENKSFKTLSENDLPKQLESGTDQKSLLSMVQNSVSKNCKQNSSKVR